MVAGRLFTVAAVVVAATLAISAGPASAQFSTYSASGTHSCGQGRTCVVTGLSFSTCIDATSALRLRDCCQTSQNCTRDATTGERRCEGGSKSVGFHLNYCIGGR